MLFSSRCEKRFQFGLFIRRGDHPREKHSHSSCVHFADTSACVMCNFSVFVFVCTFSDRGGVVYVGWLFFCTASRCFTTLSTLYWWSKCPQATTRAKLSGHDTCARAIFDGSYRRTHTRAHTHTHGPFNIIYVVCMLRTIYGIRRAFVIPIH